MSSHPRHKLNAAGSWYSTGDCMACGAPEDEAPTLLAGLSDDNLETFFVRQPETLEEVEQACRAAEVCCVNAIRYGGRDPVILKRLRARSELLDCAASGSLVEVALHRWQARLRREPKPSTEG